MSNYSLTSPTINVIDDDPSSRAAAVRLLRRMHSDVLEFDCAEAFLADYDSQPGLLVCDVLLPEMSGIDLQLALARTDVFLPIVFMTKQCNTRLVVNAIRNGATTVLRKPFTDEELLIGIHEAVTDYRRGIESYQVIRDARLGLAKLTESEKIVAERIIEGCSHTEIALELDISVRTALLRRKSIFRKMNVANVVGLVRLVLLVETDNANRERLRGLARVSAGFGGR